MLFNNCWNLFLIYQYLFCFTSSTILYPMVDVKGNGAIRQIRLLYDIYDTSATNLINQQIKSASKVLSKSNLIDYLRSEKDLLDYPAKYWPLLWKEKYQNKSIPPYVMYPWSTGPRFRNSEEFYRNRYNNWLLDDNITPKQLLLMFNNEKRIANSINRLRLQHDVPVNYLIRGRPLFAEVDFVPRYIPQWTQQVAISVTMPAHIRGRQWILGYHQEQFPMPACRLCTNLDQSYTIPVTIFLPDDGWCPEGRVQTIWKIEAIQNLPLQKYQSMSGDSLRKISLNSQQRQQTDQTDLILAYGYDDLKQLLIKNHNTSTQCRNIHEAIVA